MTDHLKRRGLLLGLGALFAAPAIAKAANLMPVSVPSLKLWGDGIHDDTEALQDFVDRRIPTGLVRLPSGVFKISHTFRLFGSDFRLVGNGATIKAAPGFSGGAAVELAAVRCEMRDLKVDMRSSEAVALSLNGPAIVRAQ